MPGVLSALLPWVVATVLFSSAIGKLRHPSSVAAWAEMGVPAVLRRAALVTLHPWLEMVLAVAIVASGDWPGAVAAATGAVLLLIYTVLVWRAHRRPQQVNCACFGASSAITGMTVWRNAWLTILAAAAVAAASQLPRWGGAVRAAWLDHFPAWLGGALVAVTCLLISAARGGHPNSEHQTEGSLAAVDEHGDYLRARTPAVPVTLADGTVVTLRRLTRHRPLLLLAVSGHCSACHMIVAALPEYRRRLPEVDVRLLLNSDPDIDPFTERTEPQSLHDVHYYVSSSIADWPVPAAVLFGTDGMIAGGPVAGAETVQEFVDIIDEDLHGGQED